MSGRYLYCQNTSCGVYLGSLGGDDCWICGWSAGRYIDEDEETGDDESHATATEEGGQDE